MIFQSTLSVRRATVRPCLIVVGDIISIHALRKESDSDPQVRLNRWNISIHALRKESDLSNTSDDTESVISIHALRKESDEVRDHVA